MVILSLCWMETATKDAVQKHVARWKAVNKGEGSPMPEIKGDALAKPMGGHYSSLCSPSAPGTAMQGWLWTTAAFTAMQSMGTSSPIPVLGRMSCRLLQLQDKQSNQGRIVPSSPTFRPHLLAPATHKSFFSGQHSFQVKARKELDRERSNMQILA